jgi:hypothetical protein
VTTKLKWLLAVVSLVGATNPVATRAEEICIDGGATGPIPISLPEVCVSVP